MNEYDFEGQRESSKATQGPPEQALLVGVEWKAVPEGKYSPEAWPVTESLAELAQLATTAGLVVAGQTTQKLERPNMATFVGKGKAEEIVEMVQAMAVDVVIFDDELSPRHQRELEKLLGPKVKLLDRTGLILDIFAQHAHTREGALQVELAQYQYRLPRLTQAWMQRALTRQAGGRAGGSTGGVGLRGPGETKLELDRRNIARRIAQIKTELESVRAHRARHREQRRRGGVPTIALVGYTNAGKSTLLHALSGADIYIADQLFATLDPTTRRVELPGGALVLLTDTVGFIQKLPTTVVAAFRATLEEVVEADLLIHVIDASHPHALEQARAVYATLKEIGAAEVPLINVLNKVDRLSDPVAAAATLADLPDSVALSALTGQGLDILKTHIEEVLVSDMQRIDVVIPFTRGELTSLFHERGLIDTEEHVADGTHLRGRLPRALTPQFTEFRYVRRKPRVEPAV